VIDKTSAMEQAIGTLMIQGGLRSIIWIALMILAVICGLNPFDNTTLVITWLMSGRYVRGICARFAATSE
jgi:hypothetical protein